WKGDRLSRLYEHLVRYSPADAVDALIAKLHHKDEDNVDFQYLVFKGTRQGLARRGAKETAEVRSWGTALAIRILKKYPPVTKHEGADAAAMQQFAADLAGKYKIQSAEPVLISFLDTESVANDDAKLSALRSLLTLNTNEHATLAGRMLRVTGSSQVKSRVATMLADFSCPAVNGELAQVNDAPPDLQSSIVMALAASPEGKNIIFRKVKNGELL